MASDVRPILTPRLLIGIFITVVGTSLLVQNLDFYDAAKILRFWPVALISLGGLIFTQAADQSGRTSGIIMMGIGAWTLLSTLGIVRIRFWDLFWPIVLIIVGSNLMMGSSLRARSDVVTSPHDSVNLFAIMGGVGRQPAGDGFRSGEMFALMGGCKLDLRNVTLAPGDRAIVNVFAVMGGHEIRVPEGWTIVSDVLPVMGGVDDKTKGGGAASPTLFIRGFVMMGGVEIKN